jgi:hypothetical protein
MVYTKHPVWYIPYGSFTIYQRGNYFIYEDRVLTEAGGESFGSRWEMPVASEIKDTNIFLCYACKPKIFLAIMLAFIS